MLLSGCFCPRTLSRLRPASPLSRPGSIRSAGALVPGSSQLFLHPTAACASFPCTSRLRSFLTTFGALRPLRRLLRIGLRRGVARAKSLRMRDGGPALRLAHLLCQVVGRPSRLVFSGAPDVAPTHHHPGGNPALAGLKEGGERRQPPLKRKNQAALPLEC